MTELTAGQIIKNYWKLTDTGPGHFERGLIRINRKRMARNALSRIKDNSVFDNGCKVAATIEKELESD